MFPLIETIIGFSVIMLILSFLVKSLASVVKNHIDYYSKNLKWEVERLIHGTIGENWSKWETKVPWLKSVQWQRLGEEYLNKENMEWLLTKLGASPKKLENLETRLEIHKANLNYVFSKRMTNISLAFGLALCLFLNINAFTIWDTLYNDQQVRAKFSSQEYVDSTKALIEGYEEKFEELDKDNTGENKDQKEKLVKQKEALAKQIHHFQGEVNFGIGKIWTESVTSLPGFLYEFFGSLLTGILVSIGAPYWHDLLKVLTSLRKPKK